MFVTYVVVSRVFGGVLGWDVSACEDAGCYNVSDKSVGVVVWVGSDICCVRAVTILCSLADSA